MPAAQGFQVDFGGGASPVYFDADCSFSVSKAGVLKIANAAGVESFFAPGGWVSVTDVGQDDEA